MAIFYLIRHGTPDYSERNTKIYQGFGTNLAPLSKQGISEIKHAAKDGRLSGTDIILSSPYTRALQTAAILSKELQADIAVETDLHEWMANKEYIFEPDDVAISHYRAFCEQAGVYPDGSEQDWEDRDHLRARILPVLEQYSGYEKVAVCCHGMIIQALCDGYHARCGEIVAFQADRGTTKQGWKSEGVGHGRNLS